MTKVVTDPSALIDRSLSLRSPFCWLGSIERGLVMYNLLSFSAAGPPCLFAQLIKCMFQIMTGFFGHPAFHTWLASIKAKPVTIAVVTPNVKISH